MLVVWRRGHSHGHEQRTLSSYLWCLSCLQSIRSSKYSRCKTYSKHWAKAQRSGPSPGKIILLLLLLLSRFSCVWLCATPKMVGSPPAYPLPWDSPGKNAGVDCNFLLQCLKVKSESEVPQSCPTLSDPMDCTLSGFSIHGIFQARVLEWVAIAFSGKIIPDLSY